MFFQLFDKLCSEDYCGLMLKKLDKKRERYIKSRVHQTDDNHQGVCLSRLILGRGQVGALWNTRSQCIRCKHILTRNCKCEDIKMLEVFARLCQHLAFVMIYLSLLPTSSLPFVICLSILPLSLGLPCWCLSFHCSSVSTSCLSIHHWSLASLRSMVSWTKSCTMW